MLRTSRPSRLDPSDLLQHAHDRGSPRDSEPVPTFDFAGRRDGQPGRDRSRASPREQKGPNPSALSSRQFNSLARKLRWWPRAGSNRRHRNFQSRALPTELPGHRRRGRVQDPSAPSMPIDIKRPIDERNAQARVKTVRATCSYHGAERPGRRRF